METRDWYDTPLYYDIVFGPGTRTEGDFLEAMWRRHGSAVPPARAPRLLEPACGSGRLLAEMARRGWEVSGFDASEASLRFARHRLGRLRRPAVLWSDRLESFTVPGGRPFDLVHCLVSTFKYLATEADARSHLARAGAALRPGGLYVLGLHLTDYARRTPEHERWVASRRGVTVTCNTRTWPADSRQRMEDLRCRLRVEENGVTRLQETRWRFRTYDSRQLRATIRAALPGFAVVACHDFNHDPDFSRRLDDEYPDLVVVLKRPG